jgi:transposase
MKGEDVSLFLPWVNTVMMNIYLKHLSSELGERSCLLVLDQAGRHSSVDLELPENIEPVYLPPYSPELNPVERLWQWLKMPQFTQSFFPDLDKAMDSVQWYLQKSWPPVH